MYPIVKAKSRKQRLQYAIEVREKLIFAGFEDQVDDIFAAAGPGFAQDSIEWLDEAANSLGRCTFDENLDILAILDTVLCEVCSPESRLDRKKVSKRFVEINIVPPEADCDAKYFRILAGAKAAIPGYYSKQDENDYEEEEEEIN